MGLGRDTPKSWIVDSRFQEGCLPVSKVRVEKADSSGNSSSG